jgi:hypothetical protein
VLRGPSICPPPVRTRNIVSAATVGVLLIELYLTIRDEESVLTGVPVFFPNLSEHPPGSPVPPSIEVIRI